MQMQPQNMPISKKVESAIEHVLRKRMSSYGYRDARSYVGTDADGDPVIMVDVNYDLIEKPIGADATFGLTTALRDELAKLGEFRFPHIRHHFDERQKVAV